MPKRIGRAVVEVNINSPQDGHIPVFDLQTRLWNTISTSSLALATSSVAINAISASYLSGSTAIVTNFTSSLDISVRGLGIGRGTFSASLHNIVIGSGSLRVTASSEGFSSSQNLAIGDLALSALTLGASNIALGYSALNSFTSSYSTAVGSYALWKSPSGRNTALGQAAAPYLATGSNNTALGDSSMFYLVHGKNNTAVGNVALRDLVEGDDNTAVGSGAIYRFFVSGSRNTVVGFDTAGGIRTGSFNTIIGARVQGLPSVLNNNIILSDGEGNIRARYNSSAWTLSDSTLGSFTGSLYGTASWAKNALTASFAPAYLPLTGGTIDGNVTVNGTASISFLNVTYESASVIYSSGSNQFGDAGDDVQTLYGTVVIPTGSLIVTGSITSTAGITSSLFGTASWANNAISSSQASTASYVNVLNQDVVVSGSISVTGSQGSTLFVSNADTLVFTGSMFLSGSIFSTGSIFATEITSSLFGTASWALNALTASYVPASAVQGLSLFRISTGSISASLDVSPQSLFLINSGSTKYLNVSSSGNTDLYSDLFVVRSFVTNRPIFTVSQSVYKFATQSSAPSVSEEVGALWFTSTDVYVSLD